MFTWFLDFSIISVKFIPSLIFLWVPHL